MTNKSTNKKLNNIGIDGLNFEMFTDADKYLELTPLVNSQGREFGNVEVKKGKIYIYLNLPKGIRKNNIRPFCIIDITMLKNISYEIERALKQSLKGIISDDTDILTAEVKSIECNITQRVSGDSSCSQVLNFLNRSFPEETNIVYQRGSSKCKYHKENESLTIKKKNYYTIKCYNKSLEQRNSGNTDIENNLLRIEIVMQDRILKKLFCENLTIRDVLTEQGIMELISEYKRIFVEDIGTGHIKCCVNEVINILFESLKETNSPVKTIALNKELIMDDEILRLALRKWHKYNRRLDNSRQDMYRLKDYDFPKDVLKTLKSFKTSCEKNNKM